MRVLVVAGKRKQVFELTEEILTGVKPLLMLYKWILKQQPSKKKTITL